MWHTAPSSAAFAELLELFGVSGIAWTFQFKVILNLQEGRTFLTSSTVIQTSDTFYAATGTQSMVKAVWSPKRLTTRRVSSCLFLYLTLDVH